MMPPRGDRPARLAVRSIIRRLETVFGRQRWQRWGDGLSELVGTILSQNTSSATSGPAYEQLEAAFPARGRAGSQKVDWNAMADAPVSRIQRAIRSAGLSRQKSRRIKAILNRIRAERGDLSLEFLADWPADKARDWLLRFPGVGPKTAACVLLFSFNKPVLPVDTHIHRIAIRLGLIGPRTSAEHAHQALERLVPAGQYYNFHILLIRHGRQVCRAARPRCHDCPLLKLCPTGPQLIRAGQTAGSPRL